MHQRRIRSVATAAAVFVLSVSTLVLVSAESGPSGTSSPADIDNTTFIDANDLLMFVSNTGRFGTDNGGVFGLESGLFYPYTTIADITNGTNAKTVLNAGGLWLGGVDATTGDTVLALAVFSTEYYPGPMDGGSFVTNADTINAYRVYKVYADSAEGNPSTDYNEWPDSLGAPVDGSNRPAFKGEQTLWSVFNDANPATRFQAGNTAPIGVEVHATFWADNETFHDSHSIYAKYKLFNKGSRLLNDFYISVWLDPDLGSATDDKTGCDSLAQMFFCYNGDDNDLVYGAAPPAVGVKIAGRPDRTLSRRHCLV